MRILLVFYCIILLQRTVQNTQTKAKLYTVILEDINKTFPVMAGCGASVTFIFVVKVFKGAKKRPH